MVDLIHLKSDFWWIPTYVIVWIVFTEFHVKNPEELRIYQPDVVFILARFSADELVKKARRFGIRNVITFDSLL